MAKTTIGLPPNSGSFRRPKPVPGVDMTKRPKGQLLVDATTGPLYRKLGKSPKVKTKGY